MPDPASPPLTAESEALLARRTTQPGRPVRPSDLRAIEAAAAARALYSQAECHTLDELALAAAADRERELVAALRDANSIVAMTRKHLSEDHPECAYAALGVLNDDSRRTLATIPSDGLSEWERILSEPPGSLRRPAPDAAGQPTCQHVPDRDLHGARWPARCRNCSLVTEDPDGFFYPADWDEDTVPDERRCPTSPGNVHELDDRPRCVRCGALQGAALAGQREAGTGSCEHGFSWDRSCDACGRIVSGLDKAEPE